MKKLKSLAVLFIAAMVLLLVGCGQKFDAQGYIQGELDAVLKGEITDDYLKLVDSSREEIEAESAAMLDEVMEQFSGMGLSDELVGKYRDYMSTLMKKCKYTVGEATKDGDSYTVPVTIEPLLFGDAMETAMAGTEEELMAWATEAMSSGETPTDAEIMEKTFELLYNALNANLDSIGYGESKEHVLNVVKGSDGKYTVAEDEVTALGASMIDPGSF